MSGFWEWVAFFRVSLARVEEFFSLISGGRFSGPGDPRKVGGSRLDTASGKVAARVDAALCAADTVALTLDGAGDVNGKMTYNVTGCLPRPLHVGSFRLGAMVASAPNLLLAFRACLPSSLHHPVTDVLQKWPATAKSQRLQALGSRRLWALCTDNASVMVSMRNAAEADGLVLASYGCFAHAVNLVSKDLCARAPFSAMLKSVIASTVFFRRCVRGRAELAEDRAIQKAAGNKTSELRTFSPTRWVGQSLTLRSFIDNLPGLRRVLLFNSHKPAGIAFAVPPVVAAAVNDGAVEATARDLLPCLHQLFRMSASLEADASPLSSVLGLFSALHIILRGNIFGVLGATRSFVSDCLVARFSSYSHPLMVLAFFLDPFYAPCRQQVGVDLWGGEHLPTTRGRAVHSLCDGDAELEDVILRELGSFLRQTDVRTSALCGRLLHPAIWWGLYGAQWPTLLFLASRIFILPTSSAGSERTSRPSLWCCPGRATVLSTKRWTSSGELLSTRSNYGGATLSATTPARQLSSCSFGWSTAMTWTASAGRWGDSMCPPVGLSVLPPRFPQMRPPRSLLMPLPHSPLVPHNTLLEPPTDSPP